MPDVFTKAKRSEVMSLIRSRGNRATELRFIALMREHGIAGWRRNARVFGKPDFVFRAARHRGVRGWLLLARLPAPCDDASKQPRFLEGEVDAQRAAGPRGDAGVAGIRLRSLLRLGVRAHSNPRRAHR